MKRAANPSPATQPPTPKRRKELIPATPPSSSSSSSSTTPPKQEEPAHRKLDEETKQQIRTGVSNILKAIMPSPHEMREVLVVVKQTLLAYVVNLKDDFSHEQVCPICHDTNQEGATFRVIEACGHPICDTCYCQLVANAIKKSDEAYWNLKEYWDYLECPVCRTKFTGSIKTEFDKSKRVTAFDIKRFHKEKANAVVDLCDQ